MDSLFQLPARRGAETSQNTPAAISESSRGQRGLGGPAKQNRPARLPPPQNLQIIQRCDRERLRNHDGKGVQQTNEGRPARWKLSGASPITEKPRIAPGLFELLDYRED